MPAKSPATASSRHAALPFFSSAGLVELGFERAGLETPLTRKLNAKSIERCRNSNAKIGLLPARHGNTRDSIANDLMPTEASVMNNQIAEPRANSKDI